MYAIIYVTIYVTKFTIICITTYSTIYTRNPELKRLLKMIKIALLR